MEVNQGPQNDILERRTSKVVKENYCTRSSVAKEQSVRQGGAKDESERQEESDGEGPELNAKGMKSHQIILAEE